MKNSDRAAYALRLQRGARTDSIPPHGPADGLTKREHFAAMAMQGFISDEAWSRKAGMGMAKLATLSVEAADALLAELETVKKGGGE